MTGIWGVEVAVPRDFYGKSFGGMIYLVQQIRICWRWNYRYYIPFGK